MVNVCGTGAGNFPLPGDPDNNVILKAVSTFGGINVSWTFPAANAHAVAHTRLYRSTGATFNEATLHTIVAGNFFYDQVPINQYYYYWVQIVSVNGTIGATIGPAAASSNGLVADMLTTLTGKIDEGLLAQTLRGSLSQISILNANLAAEIFDRETGETSLADALIAVQNGVAEAHTFITTEINSRVTDVSAIAESIDLLAVTLGDQQASVVTSTSAWIDDVTGDIGAMYTARLTVNNLIGGFGLLNDGIVVEAGFDVDTFWVGRTNADKVKPFIISGGKVYIDDAYIRNVTADKISISTDIITNGKGIFNGIGAFGSIQSAISANSGLSAPYGVQAYTNFAGASAVRGHATGSCSGIQGIAGAGGVGVLAQNFSGGTALSVVGPMAITSTALVTNLNAERLGNYSHSNWARTFPTNSGTANASGAGVNFVSSISGIEAAGSGNTVTYRNISDERKKQDIVDNTLGLEFINKHRTRSYKMRANPELIEYGMIAQEVETIVDNPESSLVVTHADGFKGISYNGYIAVLIKAVQELSTQVDSLKEEISSLKKHK